MYIYIGEHYHRGGLTLCAKDKNGDLVQLEKKIGKTINLVERESELGRTKSPIGYSMMAAWKTDNDTNKIETSLHRLLDHDRVHGEWFKDTNDDLIIRVADYMKINGYEAVEFPRESDDEQVISDRKTIIRDTSLRPKINELLVGETFRIKDIEVTVLEKGFLCSKDNRIYGSLNSAFSPLGQARNTWYDAKNKNGENVMERLQKINQNRKMVA